MKKERSKNGRFVGEKNKRVRIMTGMCIMMGCRNEGGDGVSLHLFPKDANLRQAWTDVVKLTRANWDGPSNFSKICSAHFAEDAFEESFHALFNMERQRRLKPNAVPIVKPIDADMAEKIKQGYKSATSKNHKILQSEDTEDVGDDDDDAESLRTAKLKSLRARKQPSEMLKASQSTSPKLATCDTLPKGQAKVKTEVSAMETRDAASQRQEESKRSPLSRKKRRKRDSTYLKDMTPHFKKKRDAALKARTEAVLISDTEAALDSKGRVPKKSGKLHCLCRSSDSSQFTIVCSCCDIKYHGRCVGVEERAAQFISKYACPKCRDKDPTLNIVYRTVVPSNAEDVERPSTSKEGQEMVEDILSEEGSEMERKGQANDTWDTSSDSDHVHRPHSPSVPFSIGWIHNYAKSPKRRTGPEQEPKEVTNLSNVGEDIQQKEPIYVDSGEDEAPIYVESGDESTATPHSKVKKRKLKRCNNCINCSKIHDCGRCRHCVDKKKFGGPGLKKQKCIKRTCIFEKFSIRKTYGEVRKREKMLRKEKRRGGKVKKKKGPEEMEIMEMRKEERRRKKQHHEQLGEHGSHSANKEPIIKKRLKVMCMKCPPCNIIDDCGVCRFCLDKSRFGGPNKMRQKCVHRRCLNYSWKRPQEKASTSGEENESLDSLTNQQLPTAPQDESLEERGEGLDSNGQPPGPSEGQSTKSVGPSAKQKDSLYTQVSAESSFTPVAWGSLFTLMRDDRNPQRLPWPRPSGRPSGRGSRGPYKKKKKKAGKKSSLLQTKMFPEKKMPGAKIPRQIFFCNECKCHENKDCMDCSYCRDMPRYGGPGKYRQRCKKRQCGKECPNYIKRRDNIKQKKEYRIKEQGVLWKKYGPKCRHNLCDKKTWKKNGCCSSACEIRVATDKIFASLPKRIESWMRCGKIAGQLASDLGMFCSEVKQVQFGIKEMFRHSDQLRRVLTRAKKAEANMDRGTQVTGDGADEMEKPIVIKESKLARLMRSSGRNDETVEVMDYSWSLQSKKNKNKTVSMCCCPLVANIFDKTDCYCPLPKDQCPDHQGWQKLIKAEIEMEIVRGCLRVNRLLERQQELDKLISSGCS